MSPMGDLFITEVFRHSLKLLDDLDEWWGKHQSQRPQAAATQAWTQKLLENQVRVREASASVRPRDETGTAPAVAQGADTTLQCIECSHRFQSIRGQTLVECPSCKAFNVTWKAAARSASEARTTTPSPEHVASLDEAIAQALEALRAKQ